MEKTIGKRIAEKITAKANGIIKYLLTLKSLCLKRNNKTGARSGMKTRELWYIKRFKPKAIAEILIQNVILFPFDLTPTKNAHVPNIDQKTALLVSNATLENCKCQGDIAKNNAEIRAMVLFLKSSKTIR